MKGSGGKGSGKISGKGIRKGSGQASGKDGEGSGKSSRQASGKDGGKESDRPVERQWVPHSSSAATSSWTDTTAGHTAVDDPAEEGEGRTVGTVTCCK